jgi:hypothetical protein
MRSAPVAVYAALCALLALAAGAGSSCRHGSGGPDPGPVAVVVDCAADATRAVALQALGDVNRVLGDTTVSDEAALAQLSDLAVRWGVEVIRCIVSDQGGKFRAASARNPDDRRSALAARRSRLYLEQRHGEALP